MELWIRSQEREVLIKCEKIMIKKCDDIFAILNYIDTREWFRLGLYKTKERALEVLDEIQKLINTFEPKNMAKMIVYEMPKE